jgi:thiamine biosynthesis lipoprotein
LALLSVANKNPVVAPTAPARVAPASPNAQKRKIPVIIKPALNSWALRKNFRVFTQVVRYLLIFSLVCLLSLTACQRQVEQSANLFVFGTIVEIKLWGASDEEASEAFAELQQMFQAMHRDWHAWEPGRLTDINEAFAAGQSATADEDIVEMVRRSQKLEQQSAGRFNPAIGALIRLWGFHTSDYPIEGPAPSQAQISRILDLEPSSGDIQIQGLQLSSENPSVQSIMRSLTPVVTCAPSATTVTVPGA